MLGPIQRWRSWFGCSAEGPSGGEAADGRGRLPRGFLSGADRCWVLPDKHGKLPETWEERALLCSRRIRASEIEGKEASKETVDVFKWEMKVIVLSRRREMQDLRASPRHMTAFANWLATRRERGRVWSA